MKNLICTVTVLAVGSVQADTIYVDDDAPLNGDGSSWASAYTFLQDALGDAVAAGGVVTEIRVAQGIYSPDRDEAGAVKAGDRAATFGLVEGVTLAGGFAGLDAADPDDRNFELYETVLSGDLDGDDGPDFLNNDENSYHVVSSDQSGFVLDGFTITGGNANGGSEHDLGGGVNLPNFLGSDQVISNCKLIRNVAAGNGGGLYSSRSVTVTNCTISGNVGSVGPGASAGGVWIGTSGSLDMDRCRVTDNTGDGVRLGLKAFCHVSDSVITGNTRGGVIAGGSYSGAFIDRCILSGNLGTGAAAGGGSVRNCVISGNLGSGAGTEDGRVINCTIYGNAGFGVFLFRAGTAENCIIWNNALGSLDDPFGSVFYSNAEGLVHPFPGDIEAEPLFVDPDGADDVPGTEDDDLRLLPGSPGIDAGSNLLAAGTTDLDGNPRFFDDPLTPDCQQAPGTCGDPPVVDMGAYELQCFLVTSEQVTCHPNASVTYTVEGVSACTQATMSYSFTASGGVVGEELCFTVLVSGPSGFCCTTEICVTIPDCTPERDLDGDGIVGMVDFLALLDVWGSCSDCGTCPADFDGDCSVGILDMLILLGNWG